MPSGPRCCWASVTRSRRWPPCRAGADRAARIEALAAIPEQIVGFLAERLSQGIPTREPMLEVLARRHYREYQLHDLQTFERRRPRRPWSRATPSTTARPGWSPRSARWRSWSTAPTSSPRSTTHVTARAAHEEAVVDLYLALARRPRLTATRRAEELRSLAGRAPAGPRRTTRLRRRRAPAATGRSATSSSAPTRGPSDDRGRGRPDPWRAPDGRAAPRPVAAAQLRHHPRRGARRRAALRLRRPGEPRGPAAGGPRAGAPDVRRTRRGRHHHLAAARRARGGELPGVDPPRAGRARLGRRQARHEPRLGHRLAGRRPRPRRARRARHQDQPADRRRRRRGGRGPGPPGRPRRRAGPDGRALQRPAGIRRRLHGRGAADRAAQAPRRLRLQGRAVAPPRARLPLRAERACSPVPAARSSSTTSTTTRSLVPVDRPYGLNTAGILAAVVTTPTPLHPEGVQRVVLCGDPTKSLGSVAEQECLRVIAALDLAERMQRAGGVVRALRGRADLDGLRHREHGLGGQGAAPDRGVHPGRRRDQRRGRRHQRRRPAVLERRGHDADAHQGHPGDDPGERDGAHRQAVARLLRRRLGRGQLRHRRLRPGDGSQRAGAVLGARPGRRLRRADGALRAHLRRAGGERPASRSSLRPVRPRHLVVPARRRGQRLPRRSARSSPRSPTRTARRPSTSAR